MLYVSVLDSSYPYSMRLLSHMHNNVSLHITIDSVLPGMPHFRPVRLSVDSAEFGYNPVSARHTKNESLFQCYSTCLLYTRRVLCYSCK